MSKLEKALNHLTTDLVKSKFSRKEFKNGKWVYYYKDATGKEKGKDLPEHSDMKHIPNEDIHEHFMKQFEDGFQGKGKPNKNRATLDALKNEIKRRRKG